MLNIVIPMAGLGTRFSKANYTEPKPLIPLHGVPMIQVVVKNLTPSTIPHHFIFICQKEHIEKYNLAKKLKTYAPNTDIIALDHPTEGAACTVLTAKSLINNNLPLMIANCDQYIDIAIDDYLHAMDARNLDGLIMTMQANDPKWSFVGTGENGLVNKVVEKEVISDKATVGIYNFRRGSDFVTAAEKMIKKNERVNGEFYVAPTYNQLIAEGQSIGSYSIGGVNAGMYGLGTPPDLEFFLSHRLSHEICV